MSQTEKVQIKKLPTGIPGLDDVLGGGIPEFSFNIIAGSPGCGKTTLAHQFIFANATAEKPALYFTVLGEPAIKMLRYQQQYDFFDSSQMGTAIRFVNLGDIVESGDIEAVLTAIIKEVEATSPALVIVDSFRTVVRKAGEAADLQSFTQRLALHLTSWEVTSLLVGEYTEIDLRDNPVFTIADGLIWLSQVAERNSVIRKLQVMKLRGQGSVPGLHTFRITQAGLQAFSRTLGLMGNKNKTPSDHRLSTGIPELDKMLGGGIPEGDSILIAGPAGSGKSLIATEFISEGQKNKEPGIIAIFEERPEYYVGRAAAFGMDFKAGQEDGTLQVLYLRPLDLSIEEAMQEILDAVKRIGAKRLVIDSLSGFEMALAPGFRTDFRESLYRMIAALTGTGVTVLSTVEIEESFTALPFSTYSISFLCDDMIRLRYAEIEGELCKLMMIIKMRGGKHSRAIREFDIASEGGLVIGASPKKYRSLITGVPEPRDSMERGQELPDGKPSDE